MQCNTNAAYCVHVKAYPGVRKWLFPYYKVGDKLYVIQMCSIHKSVGKKYNPIPKKLGHCTNFEQKKNGII